jgi:cell division initiation protein
MTLTPVELRHVKLNRGLFGYRKKHVKRLLEEIADSYEHVWRERADLADKLETVEAEVGRYHELEEILRTTLVSAERSAQELREQAHREASLIINEAHAEARSITHRSLAERERIDAETHRIRAMLRSALETIGEPDPADAPLTAEAA